METGAHHIQEQQQKMFTVNFWRRKEKAETEDRQPEKGGNPHPASVTYLPPFSFPRHRRGAGDLEAPGLPTHEG